MVQNELKTVDFYVKFYNGMGPQKIEFPKDIELTLVYETEENENKYIGIGKHIDDAEYKKQLGVYKNYIEKTFNLTVNTYLYSIIENHILKVI